MPRIPRKKNLFLRSIEHLLPEPEQPPPYRQERARPDEDPPTRSKGFHVCDQCGLPKRGTIELPRPGGRKIRLCRGCEQSYTPVSPEERRHLVRARAVTNKWDLTDVEYDDLLYRQNYCCAICHQPPTNGEPLAIDHDHRTGRIRGLLCPSCNKGLGFFRDNPNILASAIRYLESEM